MNFDQWFKNTTDRLRDHDTSDEFYVDGVYLIDLCDPELVNYNRFKDGSYEEIDSWAYPCRGCDKLIFIRDHCCITEFLTDMAYCGGSPSCIP